MLLPDSLTDKLIRLKLGVHKTPLDRFEVRIARTVRDYERAFRLLHVAYVYQGIEDVESERMRITKQHVLPESTVLVALEGEKLVATMTVTLDSSAGLPFDEDYPQQMQELRKSKARIVEYGSLAIVRRCWHSGVGRLMEIAGHAWSTRVLGATHCVAGVNPAAVPHYRALYGFQKVGAPRAYHDLDAPVQGLVVDFSEALAHIGRCFTKPLPDGRLYHEHLTGKLADCIKVPTEVALEDLVRWKLPREVFQELFIAKSDRLYSLDSKTLEHLRRWRTDTTLHPPVRGSSGS
ncbi:MAG: hypothetical protein HY901_01090 [Deltaproteobacteria bacterium]|nr:hypothetical protein [Deltaproteobacteria bacterium]